MATTTSPPSASPASESDESASASFLVRHQFLIYRLFSLSGLFPVGAYLCLHLVTNASVLNGAATYQNQVNQIHSLGLLLPIVEWLFIFIPILFHAVIGWVLISGALPNTSAYPYANNFRYTLQRITAIIVFFFIVFHVLHMHQFLGGPVRSLGGAQFDPEHAASSAGRAIRAALWVQAVYLIGVLAAVYHFANGLWTFGITWGIWATEAAQRRANWVSILVGVTLAAAGVGSWWGMIHLNVDQARMIEDRMSQIHRIETGDAAWPSVFASPNPSKPNEKSK